MIVALKFVPEGVWNRLALDLIDYNQHGLFAWVKNKWDMAEKHNHEGDLANVRLPEGLRGIIFVTYLADIEQYRWL